MRMHLFRATRPSETRLGRGVRRWALRVLALVTALAVLTVAAALLVVHSLDRPWLKRRVVALAHDAGGVDLDYDALRVGVLSGAELDGLVVRSPGPLRGIAADLVRVQRVRVGWRLRSLLDHAPVLQNVEVSGVTLTVIVDEEGRSSFDGLGPPGPPAPSSASPPLPLSRQAAHVLAGSPPVRGIALDDVALTLIRTGHGDVVERTDLAGMRIAVEAAPASPAPGWRVRVAAGDALRPLDLQLLRARGPARAIAHAKLALDLDVASSDVHATLDLRVADQTFAPSVAAAHWLRADASAHFDPAAGRTVVTLARAEAGDGAANVEALVEIPDNGAPIVRHAQGEVDLARILGWAPPGVVPVTVVRAHVRGKVDGLVAGTVPRLSDGGSADLDAEVAGVRADLAGGPLQVREGKLSLHSEPAKGGGIAGKATLDLGGVEASSGRARITADGVRVEGDGAQGADGSITGTIGARFARIESTGKAAASARDGRIDVHVDALHVDADDPLRTRGDVTVSSVIASLDARSPAARVLADGFALHAHSRLEGHAPYAAEVDVPVAHLKVLRPDGAPLVDGPAHVKASVRDLFLDLEKPLEARAVAIVAVDVGTATASTDVTKRDDGLDFIVRVDAPSLGLVRPFLSAELGRQAPWDRMGITVRSTGHAEHLRGGAPALEQTTDLGLTRPAFEDVAARSVSLKLHSKGTAIVHEAQLDLHTEGLALEGGTPHDDRVTLSANVDREQRTAHVQLGSEGRGTSALTASLSFDAVHRAVRYDIHAHLAALAPLAPILAKVKGLEGLGLAGLDLDFAARGAVAGVVSSVGRDGAIAFEPAPSRTAAVEGTADLHVAHLAWARGDTGVVAPDIAWHGDLHTAGARRTLVSHLEASALHLDLGPKDVDVTGIRHDSSAVVIGDLLDPETEVTQQTTLHELRQDFVPGYPIGDLTFAATAERDREGLVHLSDLKLANVAGGSTLGLSGNVEVGGGRQRLSVTATLEQDLARVSPAPERFAGRGKLALQATVTSPDLALFRLRASMKATDVFVKMPRAGIELEAANGEIPITVALEASKDGVLLRPDEKRSPYSMLRFADQHPLLARSGFLSIASLKTPFVTIAPLVGNLEVEQNMVALRQFEMGVRNGSITGQCGVLWDGPKSTLELHVRASGVQSSHGEPFDGNIAVIVAAGDRTVEGRAEILRIGERHLLDLLDLQDPLHTDPAMNRIRTALLVGYPDRLRLVFDHGFASARLELGGLARLISIGELRGIPMGPIVDRFLAPVLDPKEEP